jgi:hypothetical protein
MSHDWPCPNCPPGYLCFECEGRRNDEVLEFQNVLGIRRYHIGQAVRVDTSDFCPRCGCHVDGIEGRVVAFEGGSKLAEDGHIGPFYVVEIDHHGTQSLVYDETELTMQ